MSATQEMNELYRAWDATSRQFRAELRAAAEAEVEHRRERAKFIVAARAVSEKVSAAQAETEAEADDEISRLHLARLSTAALAEATKHRLFMLRERAASLRTERVDERERDRLYADAPIGA